MAEQVHESSPKPFTWTPTKQRAAVLVAEDELSDEAIAESVGVSRRALANWKLNAEFNAQTAHHAETLNRAMLRLAVAKKRKRLETLDTIHTKLLTVVDERAKRYQELQEQIDNQDPTTRLMNETAASMWGSKDEQFIPPGGLTGLVVRQVKQIGSGHTAQTISEYAVDTGLVKEIRAVEEQAAKELGQWSDKSEVSGSVSVVRLVGVDVDQI